MKTRSELKICFMLDKLNNGEHSPSVNAIIPLAYGWQAEWSTLLAGTVCLFSVQGSAPVLTSAVIFVFAVMLQISCKYSHHKLHKHRISYKTPIHSSDPLNVSPTDRLPVWKAHFEWLLADSISLFTPQTAAGGWWKDFLSLFTPTCWGQTDRMGQPITYGFFCFLS